MRPDLAIVIERVVALRARVHRSASSSRLIAKIDDTLTEGCAHALAADAWSMQRLRELISDGGSGVVAGELRTLASEHARFANDLKSLRRELAALRDDRGHVAASRAMSA